MIRITDWTITITPTNAIGGSAIMLCDKEDVSALMYAVQNHLSIDFGGKIGSVLIQHIDMQTPRWTDVTAFGATKRTFMQQSVDYEVRIEFTTAF